MSNILGFLGVELGLNTAAFKAGTDKATYAAKQFSGDLKKSFGELGNSFSQLGAQLGASFGPLSGIVGGATQAFGALSSAIKTATSSNVPVLLQLAGVTAGLGGAAAAAVAGYAALAIGGARVIEELSLMSQKTGVSIRDLQTLKAAGESVNVPLETMARGFRTFSRALVEGSDGAGKASITLHNLGVSAHDPYKAMLQVADGIAAIKDPALRAADASALFGARMGISLLPLLEKGSAGLQKFSDMVSEFGPVIDKKGVESTEKWKDSTVALGLAWDSVKIGATDANPALAAFNTELAGFIKSATNESVWDTVRDNFAVITNLATGNGLKVSASVSTEHSEKGGQAAAEAAQLKAIKDAQQAAADKQMATDKKAFDLIKEGGVAGRALKEAELAVSQEIADEHYKDATIIQKTIPALKLAADLEKKRSEALLNLPKTTKAFVDEQAVTVLKAYSAAIKGLGPEAAEAARQQEVSAQVQKLVNKQKEEGIFGTKAAAASLKEETTALNDASLANAALGKSAEASKMLVSFSEHMATSIEKERLMADATSEIDRAQKELACGLDKAKDALVEQRAAYDQLNLSTTATAEEKQNALKLLEQNTRLLAEDTDALKVNQEAVASKISEQAILKQTQLNAKTETYLGLLGSESEWLAKATSGALAEATAKGLQGKALQTFLDLKKQEATTQHDKVAPAEVASKAVRGPGEQVKDIQAQKAAILANAAAWQTDALATKAASKELQNLNLKELELKAASGSTFSGFKAGFQQFVVETKTAGQALQENINKGLTSTNKALAATIVQGKNLGAAMKAVGQDIAMSLIEAGLKIVESWLLTKLGMSAITKTAAATDAATQIAANKLIGLSAVGLAGAQGTASYAAAPWPIDMGAPAFGAAMATTAASFNAFEGGGIVGDTGMAMLHKREMVLPAPIAEKVTKMTEDGSGGRGGRNYVNHNHFAVSTPDANSFKMSQQQLEARAGAATTKSLRRHGANA